MSDKMVRREFFKVKCALAKAGATPIEGHAELAVESLSTALVEARVEMKRLTEVCKESNSVCACGCPPGDHESYGEEGECCGVEGHECIRTSRAVLAMLTRLRPYEAEAMAARPLLNPEDGLAERPMGLAMRQKYVRTRAANGGK